MTLRNCQSRGALQAQQSMACKRHYNDGLAHIHRSSILHFTRLYVGDLPADIAEDELRDLFEQAGRVISVQLTHPSAHHNCAFIEMISPQAIQEAVQFFHGFELRGSRLLVHSVPPPSRPRQASARDRANGR